MAKLLPCPFCGGNAYHHIKRMIHINKDRYVVKCTKCNAIMEYRNKQSAIPAWNRRTPQERGEEK